MSLLTAMEAACPYNMAKTYSEEPDYVYIPVYI